MKRRGRKEIATLLRRAEALAADGLTQAEICKQLGISVMTYHRWKKTPAAHVAAPQTKAVPSNSRPPAISAFPESDLADENRRLRTIITDLLLEKQNLAEQIENRRRAGHKIG
jgi:orotate phosphoribosyltransferase-like protein